MQMLDSEAVMARSTARVQRPDRLLRVLVTGASSGIGAQVCRTLVNEGRYVVMLVGRDEGRLRAVQAGCGAGDRVRWSRTNLESARERADLLQACEDQLGGVDVLVNCAGLWACRRFIDEGDEATGELLVTNLVAPLALTRGVLPGMLRRGWGRIVNVASLPGKQGLAYHASYGASKAGLITFSHALDSELRGSGVRSSVACLSAVTGDGMSHRHGVPAPWTVGALPVEEVARRVCSLIDRPRKEILVSRLPMRPLLLLAAAFPSLIGPVVSLLGVDRFHSRVADKLANAGLGRSWV